MAKAQLSFDLTKLKFLTPGRCVLLIGDEALDIYNSDMKGVAQVGSLRWDLPDFEQVLVQLIVKDCKKKPVLMLYDMTDQHFKGGQRIPKVGFFDKPQILKRKLQVAFPSYPIRSSLRLADAEGADDKDDAKVSAEVYLFAAIPESELLNRTLRAVEKSEASIQGLYLLAVEAASMVKVMCDSLPRTPGEDRPEWGVFIGQHHSGGLRQVVTRNGQLAMTRMTPIINDDTRPEVWAAEVAQEFKSTLGYLARFGYAPEDGTDVIVIAGDQAGEILSSMIDIPCHYSTMTALEAAQSLGLDIGEFQSERYADPLHAAWIGRKLQFTMPMDAPAIKEITVPRQGIAFATLLMIGCAAYLMFQLYSSAPMVVEQRDRLAKARQQKDVVEGDYNNELEQKKLVGVDLAQIENVVKTYEDISLRGIDPLPFMQLVAKAMGAQLSLVDFSIFPSGDVSADSIASQGYSLGGGDGQTDTTTQRRYKMTAVMTMTVPGTLEPEEGVKITEDLTKRLQGLLPGYEVKITKPVANISMSANLEGDVGLLAQSKAKQEDYVAKIQIRIPFDDPATN